MPASWKGKKTHAYPHITPKLKICAFHYLTATKYTTPQPRSI